VPSGVTFDLSSLPDDTTVSRTGRTKFQSMLTIFRQVIFEGETTWAFAEWSGPLLEISGTGITVIGECKTYFDFKFEEYSVVGKQILSSFRSTLFCC